MPKRLRSFSNFLLANEFIFLLLTLFSFIFLPSLITADSNTPWLNNVLLFFVISSSVYAVFNTHRHLYIGLILGVIAVLMNGITLYMKYSLKDIDSYSAVYLIQLIIFYVFFFYITYHVIKRVLKAKTVSLNVIFGSIAGYLLIGVLGSISSLWYFINDNTCFNGVVMNEDILADFTYFSFVTLSTLGYGDITPNTHQTKTLSVLISFIGQFYLTVLVAFLVGKFSSKEK